MEQTNELFIINIALGLLGCITISRESPNHEIAPNMYRWHCLNSLKLPLRTDD